ncbi:MAG: aminoglycoside phosphotransferase family protein [Acidimicrobiia bacterium]
MFGDTRRFEAVAAEDPLNFAPLQDHRGRMWVRELPASAADLCRRWRLLPLAGDFRTGYHGVVIPVRRDERSYVLKLTWPPDRIVDEVKALSAWHGDGAVLLLDADIERGALLLELLDAERTLQSVALAEAAAIAGGLLRRLAVPAPDGLPLLTDIAFELASGLEARQDRLSNPIPTRIFVSVSSLASQLSATCGNGSLVHADLHYQNILAGTREPWLAIDPKPVSGEPEHAVPELLWTRVDEVADACGIRDLLAVLVESAQLDADKARAWAVVRCADYWLWGLEHGLTRDPTRCERIVVALLAPPDAATPVRDRGVGT